MKKGNVIKVLAIVCQMNRCGLESRLMDIIRHNDYERVCIDVFSYREQPGILDDEIRSFGGTVYYNPPLTVKNMFWYVKYFENFLKEHEEYKIVHAHQDAWCSVFCKGAYLAGVPVRIAHSRTAISTLSINNIVKNIIKFPTRKYATHYFAVSDLAGEWLFGKKNMRNGKVQIWKNAIDADKYRFNMEKRTLVRSSLGLKTEKVIMHVGNFRTGKNQLFLVGLLEAIKKIKNVKLIFVGGAVEQEYLDRVKREVHERKLEEDILFLGSRDDVPDLLQAADILCCPSFYEGMPGAVLEAQASGLPCVISSGITKEAIILPTTKVLDLKQSIEIWRNEVLALFDLERRDTYEEMVKTGFDIHTLITDLTNFYIKIGEMI